MLVRDISTPSASPSQQNPRCTRLTESSLYATSDEPISKVKSAELNLVVWGEALVASIATFVLIVNYIISNRLAQYWRSL